jgi:hypothetical protein
MSPVLKRFSGVPEVSIESVAIVGAVAREDGEVVGAGENVNGVELKHPLAREVLAELGYTNATGGTTPREPLGGEEHAPRLRCRQGIYHAPTIVGGGDSRV